MVVETVGNELRFKNPGSLLLVVFGFAFWGVGFLDLLGHTSAEPDLFGLYSLPFFVLIVLYAITGSVWFALFFNSNLLMRVAEGVRYVQNNTRLAVIASVGLAVAFWVIFEWDRWSRLPALQFAAFGLVLLTTVILLLANWSEGAAKQIWRKVIVYPMLVLLVVEILFQILSRFEVLPGIQKIGGHFYPYERIYYQDNVIQTNFANRYGWYAPDAKWRADQNHILVVGGSHVQGLQVQPDQHLGPVLGQLINGGQTEPVEVLPIGLPGFGLSSFLFDDSVREMPNIVGSNEMIIVFHLGDDFQSPAESDNAISYVMNEANGFEVDPEDARLRHDLTHYYLRGFMSLQLVETIRSNYLTPKVISGLLRGSGGETRSNASPGTTDKVDFPRHVGHVSSRFTFTEPGHAGIKTTEVELIPGGNNFMFTQGGSDEMREAVMIADSLLGNAQKIARENGFTLRVVTVPMFPGAFYTSFDGSEWSPQVGDYDLFLPEQALVDIAEKYEISILPMGQYMLQNGLTVDEIGALYMSNEEGAFTAAGHAYFADAVYSCFYSSMASDFCGK